MKTIFLTIYFNKVSQKKSPTQLTHIGNGVSLFNSTRVEMENKLFADLTLLSI